MNKKTYLYGIFILLIIVISFISISFPLVNIEKEKDNKYNSGEYTGYVSNDEALVLLENGTLEKRKMNGET